MAYFSRNISVGSGSDISKPDPRIRKKETGSETRKEISISISDFYGVVKKRSLCRRLRTVGLTCPRHYYIVQMECVLND